MGDPWRIIEAVANNPVEFFGYVFIISIAITLGFKAAEFVVGAIARHD